MQERYTISHKGQELGPFSSDEILRKVRAGELSTLDYIYLDDKKDWVPLLEFMPAAGGARPPMTPPPTGKGTVTAELKALPTPVDAAVPQAPVKMPPQAPAKAPPTEVKAKPTEVTATAQTEIKSGTINLKGGVGTLELVQFTAGTVTIALNDKGSKGFKVTGAEEVTVTAAPAVRFTIKGQAGEVTAGQSVQFTIEAVDKWGNRDSNYAGTIAVAYSGNAEGAGPVKISSGRGQTSFTSKKAETVTAKLVDSENTGLDISATSNFVFVAGPAEQLVLSTPDTVVAGQPLKVQVKAVDKYGNVATTCNDNVLLEMSTPLSKEKAA